MIDDAFLNELGLGSLPEDEKERMKAHITETLNDRIGARAEGQLTDEQLDTLDSMADSSNDIQAWLQQNLPNYQQIVSEEREKVKDDIRPQVPALVEKFSV